MIILVKYYLVKHDIESIEKHPTWIWSLKKKYWKKGHPLLNRMKKGDKYIMYAYRSYDSEERLTIITGVYKVIQEAAKVFEKDWEKKGWYIKGKSIENIILPKKIKKDKYYININPTIFFTGNKFHNQIAIPLTKIEFNNILKAMKNYKFIDDWKIIKSEPKCEQEVVALFSYFCLKLGFKYKKVGTRFPDAIVLKGKNEYTVEFEFNSCRYNHNKKVDYIICWQHDCKRVEKYVNKRVIVLRDELINKGLINHIEI